MLLVFIPCTDSTRVHLVLSLCLSDSESSEYDEQLSTSGVLDLRKKLRRPVCFDIDLITDAI